MKIYAVVAHSNGDGDDRWYSAQIDSDHVYMTRGAAEAVVAGLNAPTLAKIAGNPNAELTAEWLGWGGVGWNLDFYTVEELEVKP